MYTVLLIMAQLIIIFPYWYIFQGEKCATPDLIRKSSSFSCLCCIQARYSG